MGKAWYDIPGHIQTQTAKDRALLGDDDLFGEGPGIGNQIMGNIFGVGDVEGMKTNITNKKNKDKYKAEFEAAGLEWQDGLSAETYATKLRNRNSELYTETPQGKAQALALKNVQAQMDNTSGQLALSNKKVDASIKATTAQTAESARQFDATQSGNRADRISARADKADDRIAQLELAEMQLAAEDRRATERWDREDKRERAQLIAQLFSGLGQTAQFI